MNLLLLFRDEQVSESRYRVSELRAAHLRSRGLAVGQDVVVALHHGPSSPIQSPNRGKGRVLSTSPLELNVQLEDDLPLQPATRLFLAVPRPKMLKRLLPQVTALGVNEIILYRSWRVQRSYLASDSLEPSVYRPLLWEGLMQACLHIEPEVYFYERFMDMIDHATKISGSKFLAHPRTNQDMADRCPLFDPVSLAFGPEGGLMDEEVESFRGAGFCPIQLRAGILRLETAVVAALGQRRLLGYSRALS